MLQNIIETPTVRNIIRDGFVRQFFDTPRLSAGLMVSLNDIEHMILRRRGDHATLDIHRPSELDPRLHVALNCAAISCPRLRQNAFTSSHLQDDLEDAMHDFANSTRHFRVDHEAAVLSSLLDWYGIDFDTPEEPAGDFILRYMSELHPAYNTLKNVLANRTSAELRVLDNIRFEYVWDINAAP